MGKGGRSHHLLLLHLLVDACVCEKAYRFFAVSVLGSFNILIGKFQTAGEEGMDGGDGRLELGGS